MDSDVAETSKWVGEAFDRSDKSLYKAYTGALKYYFANTWHVPTGDDPEADKTKPTDKPEEPEAPVAIQNWQIDIFKKVMTPEALTLFLTRNKLEKLEDMTFEDANVKLEQLKEWKKKKAVETLNTGDPEGQH
jgi:hypothetical protein